MQREPGVATTRTPRAVAAVLADRTVLARTATMAIEFHITSMVDGTVFLFVQGMHINKHHELLVSMALLADVEVL